jgi:hypothetical protein
MGEGRIVYVHPSKLPGEAEFLGQKYFQIRDASKEGWIEGRFLQLE